MENTLDLALASCRHARLLVSESEETRNLQRRTTGAVFPATERLHVTRRERLAAACLEASRLANEAGKVDLARALLVEHAEQAYLAESLRQLEGVRR